MVTRGSSPAADDDRAHKVGVLEALLAHERDVLFRLLDWTFSVADYDVHPD